MLHTTTNSGLHDFAGERVLARYAHAGVRAASGSAFFRKALLDDDQIFVLEVAR